MKSLIRGLVLSLALVGLFSTSALAGKGKAVLLKWKLKKGQVLKYYQHTVTKLKMGPMNVSILFEGELWHTVRDVQPNGTASLESRYNWVNMSMQNGKEKKAFDSRIKGALAKAKKTPGLRRLTSVMDSTFFIKVKPSGEIVANKIKLNKFQMNVPNNNSFQGMFVHFAKAAVTPGTKWSRTTVVPVSSGLLLQTHYKFKSWKKCGKHRCVHLDSPVQYLTKGKQGGIVGEGGGSTSFIPSIGRLYQMNYNATAVLKQGKVTQRITIVHKYKLLR
ncbi:MAG: hypothetical protein EP343_08930 [Deltaproteobacteria bacterium]|nr:MAG: hypothetical protein EP343_08930 [Deltaproteobacteria bacterium]